MFPATDMLTGRQLWASTGAPGSTVPLGAVLPVVRRLVPVAGGRAVFLVQGTHELELWGTDGTPQGTLRLPLLCDGCNLESTDLIPLGAVKTYKNPSGQFGSVGDTGAF